MLTTKTASVCVTAVLLLTACGGGHEHSPERLAEMIAEGVRTSVQGGAPGLGLPDTAFDPSRYTCVPPVEAPGTDPWRTEAPRSEADGSVELGVLVPEGTDTTSVTASVTGPGGEGATATATAVPGEWTRIGYPDDFAEAPDSPAAGTHTVIWSDGDSGAPLTCDDFESD
ncbi:MULTISPECIES: hypothetical protein [unclassified Nocardiopsis]|uniref:hypothetical protein n=1 Tax=unclassified Nocardiopsis TaxID=2649073 RepID=UPI001356E7AF|nr:MULTISPECIES: hypothetical protein [unclassified Nocardiopsis]